MLNKQQDDTKRERKRERERERKRKREKEREKIVKNDRYFLDEGNLQLVAFHYFLFYDAKTQSVKDVRQKIISHIVST